MTSTAYRSLLVRSHKVWELTCTCPARRIVFDFSFSMVCFMGIH